MKRVRAWVWAGYVTLGALGCATGGPGSGTANHSFGGTEVSDDAGSDGGSTSSCSTCSADDGGGAQPPGSPPPSDDSGLQEDAAASPVPDDASGTPPIGLPPFSLPDGGLGGSSPAPGDGGACTTKICIDPVFDCPLQGCFNGCTNFHCM